MKARYQYRFYPTYQQKNRLAQLFGCVRVVRNDAVALCRQAEKLPSTAALQKLLITQAKKTEAREWLSDVSAIPLQQSINDLGVAYKNFFDSCKGVKSVAKNQSIGIDLGLKTFAVMSNGESAKSPDYSKLDRKIRKLQKRLNRQEKQSKRREKTRVKIAKLHNRMADKRKDFLHKLSTKVVSENQVIVFENLNVKGLVKNRRLARAISQQGWSEFRSLCEAKANRSERFFQVISRWEPTSQICSDCGYKWGKLDLSIRSVLCLGCGTKQDRDLNASKNIEMVGMGHRHDLKRTQRQSKITSVASVDEVSRITALIGQ